MRRARALGRYGVLAALLASALLVWAGPHGFVDGVLTVSVQAPERFLFGVGSTVPLSARVTDQDGAAVAGAALVWNTSDAGIALVDATGKVTATGFGAVAITAAAEDGAEGTCRLKVLPELPREIRTSLPVAYIGVNVVPMDSERVLEKQTVITRDGRIVRLGPMDTVEIPEDAERIEAGDWYLMPALADLHAHFVVGPNWENDLFLFLANGVTSVREMGGSTPHLQWRQAIASGAALGPRLHLASPMMDGPGGRLTALIPAVSSLSQARRLVVTYKTAGYDYIKIYNDLTPDVYAAIMAEARAQGIKVVGHTPYRVGLIEVLSFGQYSIEHFTGIGEPASLTGAVGFEVLDESRLKILAEMVRAAETWTTPTLLVSSISHDLIPSLRQRPEMRYASPQMRALFDNRTDWPAVRDMAQFVSNLKMILRALHAADAGMVLGTDSGCRYILPGFSVHDELRLVVEAGLTPFQAIRLGTANAAAFLEQQGELGTVEAGKRADLLLLQENPLQDVANLNKRVGVIVDGRWLSEKHLRERLEEIAGSYAK